MDQHHASRLLLPTQEPHLSTPISGTPEALVIKPDLDVAAHHLGKPTAQPESAPQESNSESELFWCPWLYSELAIPDHPSPVPADKCALPPYPLCPVPLLDVSMPPVTRPALSQDFAQAFPNLALIYSTVKSAGAPQLQRSPPTCAAQHQCAGLERTQPSVQRLLTDLDVGVWISHRVHSFPFTGPILRQPSFCHPAPVRCHSLHKQGARSRSHHGSGPLSSIPVAPVQPCDD